MVSAHAGDTYFSLMQNGKSSIRRTMRQRRRALTPGECSRLSARLIFRLVRHPFFKKARRIGIYFPNDGEIDVTPVARTSAEKSFFLPVLPPLGKKRLWFAPYTKGQHLVLDRFGIPEPLGGRNVRTEQLDLVVVPLVAFDDAGGRIGMGGGFYDTSLEFLARPGRVSSLRVIGAAYDFQQVETIPKDRWDIPLHGVLTESRFIAAN